MLSTQGTLILQVFSRADPSAVEAVELRDMKLSPEEQSKRGVNATYSSTLSCSIVNSLAGFDEGAFCPHRCDVYEPIRDQFDPNDITAPVSWLSQPGGRILFKRTRVPRYECYIENRRHGNSWIGDSPVPIKGWPDPLFVLELCFWIKPSKSRAAGLENITRLFKELFLVSQGDFGFLCAYSESEVRNFLRVEDEKGAISQQFVGLDPGYALPGVYFANIFGRVYVDWFGQEKFDTMPCYFKEELNDGAVLVQCAEDPLYFESEDLRGNADAIVQHLGPDAFFDITSLDRVCSVPEVIERARPVLPRPHSWR
jgi:hypothetical protein